MRSQSDQWALLWQAKTNNVHVEPLAESLSSIRRRYTNNEMPPPWFVMAVGTQDEMLGAAQSIRPTLMARRGECPQT